MNVHLKIEDIDSSNIEAISYCSFDSEMSLAVTFRTGSEYVYYNVPFQKVLSIFSSTSVGTAFHREVLSANYQYKKL